MNSNKKNNKEKSLYVDSNGVVSDINSSQISKYNTGKDGCTGHGAAAEDANALADKFRGKHVDKVGLNNAKNGPDRISSGEVIQTKYCNKASKTVAAAFKDHKYKYTLRNGRPMKLEVPYDQYDQAVEYMKKRIIKGEVTGVKNPEHAYKMIKRGRVSYNQAVRIAETGKIEGLIYDAANGTVTCLVSAGISATITFIRDKQRGEKTSKALKNAGKQAAKAGGATLVTQVAVGQATRFITSHASKAVAQKGTEIIVEEGTKKVTQKVVEEGTKKASSAVISSLAKSAARTNIITGTVTTAITSVPDIKRAWKGEMKWSECGENVAVNAGSVAAGMACAAKGATLGLAMGGPVGSAIGTIVGGVAGSIAASAGGKAAISKVKRLFGKKK